MDAVILGIFAALGTSTVGLIAYHQGQRSRQDEVEALTEGWAKSTRDLVEAYKTIETQHDLIQTLHGIVTRKEIPIPNRVVVQQALTDSGHLLRFGMN